MNAAATWWESHGGCPVKKRTAANIDKLTVAAKSVTFKSRPVLMIPPFLMGVLMCEEWPDPSDLCMAVI
jgi:hypothetical protein